jgi:DNA-binding NarL/FixJ family response regulator
MNVLICNDRAEPLDSLIGILENNRDVTSVKVATNGRQAIDALHSSPIDISISSGTGLDFNRMLQRHIAPTVAQSLTRVVATQSPSVPLLVKAHQFGFNNVLPLTIPEEQIVPNLQRTLAGEESLKDHPAVKSLHLTPGALTHTITFDDVDDRHIVELVGIGLSDHEIAEALNLSIQYVRNRVAHSMRFNQLTNRTQLALLQNTNWQIPDFA